MSDMAGFAQSSAPLSSSKTPEPRPEQQLANGPTNSPSTPGTFTPFDWEDFETRYIQALEKADNDERLLLHEFEELVKYFNSWAASSSSHDTERAIKRLQTRQRFVNISEQNMAKRQQHMNEVLQAFQNALALLRQT